MSVHSVRRYLLLISMLLALALFETMTPATGLVFSAGDLGDGWQALMSGSIVSEERAGQSERDRDEGEFPDRSAALPGQTGMIAFASNRDNNFDIFTQPTGSTSSATVVAASSGNDVTPEWSPDGLRVLYASDQDGDFEIYVKATGGQERQLTDNGFDDVHPAWSPDGGQILFASDRGGDYFQIFAMRADGRNVHQIGTIVGNHAMYPRFSPDGGRIAFMRASIASAVCQWNWDVWLMNADGTNQKRVTDRLGADLYPHWSPDGSQIVYASCRNLLDFDLYAVDTSSGNEQRLSAWFLKNEWSATYAPDGQHLAFHTDVDGNIEVYVMPAQGGTAANLTRHSGDDLAASWKEGAGTSGYSVSGRLLDSSSHGIACATVSTGPSRSTITDGAGNYTLDGLPAGNYTITPSKAGYTFAPTNQRITGPPDAAGVNFTASESAAKHPILVIPGMFASVNWQCMLIGGNCEAERWNWFPILAEPHYSPLLDQLEAAGYDKANGTLDVLFYDWRQPIGQNVTVVRDRVQQLKMQTGASKVEVIGHSMGGLLGRAYIQSDACADDVSHLITLGSPHRGAARAYPSWEGGMVYEGGWMGSVDRFIYSLMLFYLGDLPTNTARLAAFRSVKSGKELLPIDEYLFDEENEDAPKPIASLHQQNSYLPLLEAGLPDLFARTSVSTFLGTGQATPTRFYVRGRSFLDWPLWEDGKPNWSREAEFDADGDETVPANSARLPLPAVAQTFAGVKHGELPANVSVRNAIFTTLGIPIPLGAQGSGSNVALGDAENLILALDGPAEVNVKDPSGRQVGPMGVTIPGAEYIAIPGSPFRLVIIPDADVGTFQISANGDEQGDYRLGLLDTFTSDGALPADPMTSWDTVKGQIRVGDEVRFAVLVDAASEEPPPLLAITPVIESPIHIGAATVHGWAQPGRTVVIRDANTQAPRGSGLTDSEGRFAVTLDAPLRPGQRIAPWSDGVAGVPVEVPQNTLYLPSVQGQ